MARQYSTRRETAADERGQAFTLEALFASLLLLAAILFALQTTAITPLTGSTTSQQVQNQQAASAEGVLATAYAEGALKEAALFYNIEMGTDTGGWHGLDRVERSYNSPRAEAVEDLRFAQILDEAYAGNVATNVNIHYFGAPMDRGQGDQQHHTASMINMGAPSSNAVSATRTFVLYEDDVILDWDHTAADDEDAVIPYEDDSGNPVTVGNVDDAVVDGNSNLEYYMEYVADENASGIGESPIEANSDVYNVVTVEVVVWRI